MGAKLLMFSGFVLLISFYQAEVSALDTLIRQKRAHCDGRLSGPHGTIQSPNYPSNYPDHATCTWFITVSTNSRISLIFQSFQLESSSSCQFDYLEIRDGSSSSSALLGKFCGTTIPSSIESTGNAMTLRFRTDGSSQYRGFLIEYQSVPVCGGNLISDQGDITSPNYPKAYGPNQKCTWTITMPYGYQVKLRFRSLQLETSHGCTSDAIVIYDGPDIFSRRQNMLCGTVNPPDIVSSWNTMTIVFTSDGTSNFRGFSAQYSKVMPNAPTASMARRSTPVLSVFGTTLCCILLAFM